MQQAQKRQLKKARQLYAYKIISCQLNNLRLEMQEEINQTGISINAFRSLYDLSLWFTQKTESNIESNRDIGLSLWFIHKM